MRLFRLLEQQWKDIRADWVATRDEGSVAAIGRFAIRAAIIVFVAMFKWTIPVAIFFLVRMFGS